MSADQILTLSRTRVYACLCVSLPPAGGAQRRSGGWKDRSLLHSDGLQSGPDTPYPHPTRGSRHRRGGAKAERARAPQ